MILLTNEVNILRTVVNFWHTFSSLFMFVTQSHPKHSYKTVTIVFMNLIKRMLICVSFQFWPFDFLSLIIHVQGFLQLACDFLKEDDLLL